MTDPSHETTFRKHLPGSTSSARNIPGLSSIWERHARTVMPESARSIGQTTELIDHNEAIIRWGQLLFCLVSKQEIEEAARQSKPCKRLGKAEADHELKQTLPESFYGHIYGAQIQGLKQSENTASIALDYPEMADEAEGLRTGINKILGIEYEWQDKPAIEIVSNMLRPEGLSNPRKLEETLTYGINLNPIPRIGE